MTQSPETPASSSRPSRRWLWAFGLVGLVAAAGAVYGIKGFPGNVGLQGTGPSPCDGALATAERVKPAIGGEVAALVPAAGPLLLSGLTFLKEDGSKTSVADLAGRTILLNLWATWCAPCRAEMPALDRLQAELGSKDFEVVTIDVDTTGAEKPKKFLEEIGVKSLAFRSDPTLGIFKALQKTGRSKGLPTTLLIDGKGCEIGTMYGPAQWDSPDAKRLINAILAN